MKRSIAIFLGFILIIVIRGSQVFSQSDQGSVSIETKAEPTTVKIGDLITFSVIISRGENVEIEPPGAGFTLVDSAGMQLPDDALNIRDYKFHEPEKVDQKVIERVDYIFSPFLIGRFRIPPMTVRYRVLPDSAFKNLATEPLEIVVESLNPSETGDIRDIKPPLEIERDIWETIVPFLVALGGILVVVIIIFIVKRLSAGKSIFPKFDKPPRPPHEVALEALDNLRQSGYLAEGNVKEYYIQLSDIIRRYIEGRYFIIALEMTTQQLIDNLNQDRVESEVVDTVQDLLTVCDMVKFAKFIPKSEATEIATSTAYDLVQKTKLVLENEQKTEEAESETPEAGDDAEPVAELTEGGDEK
ncbi:hypothetical protein JXJ21_17965 [candidate division KSB1 bacterium]|nr:hypothetical protein [candidate division KSB1 bacterium]